MGRNGNSIVGRLAMASESMKVCLRVLKKGNKSRYDTYSVKDVPLFIVSVISTHTPFRVWSRRLDASSRQCRRHPRLQLPSKAGASSNSMACSSIPFLGCEPASQRALLAILPLICRSRALFETDIVE